MFEEQRRGRYRDDKGPIIVVRLTPWLQKRLAALARIVWEHKLAYIAAPLVPPDHAWVVHHLFPADSYLNATSTLCVSATELWVACKRRPLWDDRDYVETFWTGR